MFSTSEVVEGEARDSIILDRSKPVIVGHIPGVSLCLSRHRKLIHDEEITCIESSSASKFILCKISLACFMINMTAIVVLFT